MKEIEDFHKLKDENICLIKENEELRNMIDRYRSLRTHKDKGFFIIKGSPSNRLFRKMIKEKEGRYLGDGQYLVKFKYYKDFENKDIIW